MKSAARSLFSSRAMLRLWQQGGESRLSVFTMHRFAVPDLGVGGHDPAEVGATLEALRRERIPILSLAQVLAAHGDGGALPGRGAIFTVDDGYFDFAEVGAPVFARFDAPVTVFLVTGFLDGDCWLWWDQIRHLLESPQLGRLGAALWEAESLGQPPPFRARLAGLASIEATRIPDREVRAMIPFLASHSNQSLPTTAPDAYRAMSWDTVRQLSRQGVSFGPHTESHPVLTQTSDTVAQREIGGSWARLKSQLAEAVPILSYPNGDYGDREAGFARAAGLSAAVTTRPQYLQRSHLADQGSLRFRIPRFPYPDQRESLLLTAAGFRRFQAPYRASR